MTAPTFAPRGPAELQRYLDVKAQELDKLSKDLQGAHNTLEQADLDWTYHYDETMEQLEEESDNGKLPGEEVRLSLARRRGGWEFWTAYRKADRQVKRLEKDASRAATVISACQSEAKLLLTEARAT